MYEEAVELERELTTDLGAATVLELYERFDYDPRGVERETSAYTSETDALYRERIDSALRGRVGVGLEDASISDFTRLWRAPEFDAGFTTERAVPALRATLAGLGIDLDAQRNVELDIESRPGKRPRAFCAPIRVPGRVVLVILPQGGQDDYQALFHEAGHTEHFASADPGAPGRAAAPGRQRRHGGLRLPVRAPPVGSRLASLAARLRARRRLRPLHGAPEALLRAPLCGQAGVRDRAPLREDARVAARPLRRAPVGGGRSPLPARRLPRGRRRRLLLHVLPAGAGPSRPSCATT